MRERSRMLSTSDHGSDNQKTGEIAMKLHGLVQTATTAAMNATGHNMVNALIVAAHSGVASVHTLAHLVAREHDERHPLTATQVLFASLLAYRFAPHEVEFGKAFSEYSPLIVVDALNDFEKLAGRRPDDELNETMCQTCRDFAADKKRVAKVVALRAQTIREADHSTVH